MEKPYFFPREARKFFEIRHFLNEFIKKNDEKCLQMLKFLKVEKKNLFLFFARKNRKSLKNPFFSARKKS